MRLGQGVARGLRAKAWRTIAWREGTNAELSSRFARVRVHVASRHERPIKPAKEWLLIEWPEGEDEPTKYWLSTLPQNIPFRDLVDAAKLRWRISATMRNSSRRSGWATLKGAAGAASTITPRCGGKIANDAVVLAARSAFSG